MTPSRLFEPLNKAVTSAIATLVTVVVGVVLAFSLLSRSMYSAGHAQLKMNKERQTGYMKQIQKSADEVQSLSVPMAIMHWSHFNAMEVLQCFEDQRDNGKLVFLDSVQHVTEFLKLGNMLDRVQEN